MNFGRMAVVCVIFLAGLEGSAVAYLTLADGRHHVLDHEVDFVMVDWGAPGVGTTLDVVDGGAIGFSIQAYEDSRVNILGGRVGESIWAYDRSQCTVAGGEIEETIFVEDNSRMEISGGSMGSWVNAYGNSELLISGGEIARFIVALENSHITISGGILGDRLSAGMDGLITLVGSDFAIDGTPVGYGDSARDYGQFGTITGSLANGDAIDIPYSALDSSDIVFIPEPASILMLGLGGLSLLRRRRG